MGFGAPELEGSVEASVRFEWGSVVGGGTTEVFSVALVRIQGV